MQNNRVLVNELEEAMQMSPNVNHGHGRGSARVKVERGLVHVHKS